MTHDGMQAHKCWCLLNVTVVTSSQSSFSLLLGYLKLWQLSKPLLDAFDAIFVDEAQDCTPGDELLRASAVADTQKRVGVMGNAVRVTSVAYSRLS